VTARPGSDSKIHFALAPDEGWDNWSRRSELADQIYEIGLEKMRERDCVYINPMAGAGIFEDQHGNYLFVETRDIGERSIVVTIHYGIVPDANSELKSFINLLVKDYDLVKSELT